MKLYQRLTHLYDEDEAKAIVRLVMEERFGLSLTDIICGKVNELSREEAQSLEEIMLRLEKGEPVQYILGDSYFYGHVFHVEPGILIPRPETEELCQWILEDVPADSTADIVDMGTGSGCIAISVALDHPKALVTAWDISATALKVANGNAQQLQAKVDVCEQDILHAPADNERWDVIVSNPPYIADKEKADMARNVLDYEPHLALFVPDDDALRFYRAIAEYAVHALRSGGLLYFEINPLYAEAMDDMLRRLNFKDITVKEDLYGKKRMMRCRK